MEEEYVQPTWNNDDDNNDHTVICKVCKQSIIIHNGIGKYVSIEYGLPEMKKRKEASEEKEKEVFQDWWLVDKIHRFENIALSNTIDGIKYLACADCENGPVGYHDVNTRKSYIAHARVLHKEPTQKE